jgi:hypothetical protein
MGAGDVFPAEMPNHPSSPIPALDDDTAERLLAGRLDPDDAPPAYADVARLLQAAAAPPSPEELAGQEAALASFRAARGGPWVAGAGSGGVRGGSGGVRDGSGGGRGRPRVAGRRPGRARGRVVAVALAGVLVAGGAVAGGAATGGLWTTGGASSSGGLRSPSGGPGAGAAGSGAPASGAPGSGVGPGAVSGSGGSGLLRPSGSAVVTERERAVARHGGGGGSRGGGTAHGAKPVRAPEAKASEAKAGRPGKPAAEKPKARKPVGKGPKATPEQSGTAPAAGGTSRRAARR